MSELQTADIHLIQRIIPHRYPFLLVDRVRDIDGTKSATGLKNVTFNEPHFQGHFPGAPIMPGVTIIEAMAQTGAILMSKTLDADISNTLIYFMGVEQAKFRRPVRPGDVLEMPVEVTANRRGIFKFKGEARVNGVRCADATFSATSAPREA